MRAFLILCLFCFVAESIANSQEPASTLENELRLILDDAFAIGILRPNRMFNVKGLADQPLADLAGRIGIKPSEVEHVVAAVVPGDAGISVIILAQSNKPFDQDIVRRVLSPRAVKVEGFEYSVFEPQENGGVTLAFPKPNQLLFSQDLDQVFDALDRFDLDDGKNDSELTQMLKAGSDSHAQLVADVAKLKHFMTYSSQEYRPFSLPEASFGFLPESTTTIQAELNINSNQPLEIKILGSENISQFQSLTQKTAGGFQGGTRELRRNKNCRY